MVSVDDGKADRPILQIAVICLMGLIASFVLLFVLSLPDKYAMTLAVGVMTAPIIFFIKDKEKFLIGAFVLSLPLTMGFMLIEQLETTNSNAAFVFQVYLSDIFLLFLLFLWLFRVFLGEHKSEHTIWQTKLTTPLVLWICMGFVSMIPAIDRLAASVGIVRMIRIFLTFLLFFHYVKGWKQIHFLVKCLLVALLLQSLLIFVQYATNSLVFNLSGVTQYYDIVSVGLRPGGTMGHSGNFAKFSGLVLPIAFAYILFAPTLRYKLFMVLIWSCGSAALVLTLSRVGVTTWLFSIILFFIGAIMLRIVTHGRKALLIIVGFFWIGISIGIVYFIAGEHLENRMKDDEGSAAARIPMFKVAFNVIKAHPITGIGLKNYTLVREQYDDTDEQISITFSDTPVHNLFLLYAAEIGVPGLLFFLWFIWRLLIGCMQYARHTNFPMDRAICLGMAIGVICILMQSLTGMGVTAHLIHLSVIAIFAACAAKQCLFLTHYEEKGMNLSHTRRYEEAIIGPFQQD